MSRKGEIGIDEYMGNTIYIYIIYKRKLSYSLMQEMMKD